MQNLLNQLRSGDGAVAAMMWLGLGLLLLIVVIAIALWLIRALRPTLNMSGSAARGGRVQRLAVTDAFPLDREGRKLVIIRRDNVEHLLLIGGPNDLLIEPSIVRSERAGRGRPDSETDIVEPAKPVAAQPINPQPNVTQAPGAASLPSTRPAAPNAPLVPPPPRPASAQNFNPPPGQSARLDDDFERALKSMETPPPPRPVAPPPIQSPPPMMSPPVMNPPARSPLPPPPAEMAKPEPKPEPKVEPKPEPMSEMARRLSEVLQKPPQPPVPRNSVAPAAAPAATPVPPPPAPAAPATPTKAAPPPPPSASEMDLLEEEMAKLLGRPGSPPKP